MKKKNAFADHVFERLQAEQESDWLDQVYVIPGSFGFGYWGAQPLAAVSESGGGKTALRIAMMKWLADTSEEGVHLVVDWRFPLTISEDKDSHIVYAFLSQIMAACARSLLQYLVFNSKVLESASSAVQDVIVGFIQQYLSGSLEFYLDQAVLDVTEKEISILAERLAKPPRFQVFSTGSTVPSVIQQLVWATQKIGLKGIYIFIDGVEAALGLDEENLLNVIEGFLASLAIFEETGFVFKLFAPMELLSLIKSSSAAQRRRIEVVHLHWNETELAEMVNRRLSYAFSNQVELSNINSSGMLLSWLIKYGGMNPRGWLRFIRPFAIAFADIGESLSEERCLEIFFQHLPQIKVDMQQQKVFCGYGEVTDISPTFYDLLAYLYNHCDRICTKSELYYLGLRKLDREPVHQDLEWEYPDKVSGRIDTELGRLRTVIEPDAKNPVYLKTYRGKGIKLENVL